MLKTLGLFLILIQTAWTTSEPQRIFVVSNGKVHEIMFKSLKRVELLTVNHHPNFESQGKIQYSGYLLRDILKNVKLMPDQPITIVGKTGQFSIEATANEILSGNNIIATHVNGKPVETEGNGLQIIYDGKTIQRYPHLTQRQFWCWWVRSLIVDSKHTPVMKISKSPNTFKTSIPWPTPYGISSVKAPTPLRVRSGYLLGRFQKIKVEILNGGEHEIVNDGKTKFILANPVNNKDGAYSLHQVIEKDGKIENFVSNIYYVKSLKVIQ